MLFIALGRAAGRRGGRARAREYLGREVDVAVRDAEDCVEQAWLGLGLG